MTRTEIIPAVQAAIAGAHPAAVIVLNDFSHRATSDMEDALRNIGWCIAIQPIMGSVRNSQAGTRGAERVHVAAHLRVNPAKAGALDVYGTHTTIIRSVLQAIGRRGELGDPEGTVTALILSDTGNLTHAIHFTVTITD